MQGSFAEFTLSEVHSLRMKWTNAFRQTASKRAPARGDGLPPTGRAGLASRIISRQASPGVAIYFLSRLRDGPGRI